MDGLRRRGMPEHIRAALEAIDRRLEPVRRLAPAVSAIPGVATSVNRRGWLLLSDGRPPALHATRRR